MGQWPRWARATVAFLAGSALIVIPFVLTYRLGVDERVAKAIVWLTSTVAVAVCFLVMGAKGRWALAAAVTCAVWMAVGLLLEPPLLPMQLLLIAMSLSVYAAYRRWG